MAQDPNNLIWIDMEMSGLNPETDRILEIAVVITTSQLEVVAEAPVLVVHQSNAVLDAMDDWNKGTHGKSGLIDRVKASTLGDAEAALRGIETELHRQGGWEKFGEALHECAHLKDALSSLRATLPPSA